MLSDLVQYAVQDAAFNFSEEGTEDDFEFEDFSECSDVEIMQCN